MPTRTLLIAGLLLATACGGQGGGGSQDGGRKSLSASSSYGSIAALATAVEGSGLKCREVTTDNPMNTGVCKLEGGGEVILYAEDSAASSDRISSLSTNSLACGNAAGTLSNGRYIMGRDWMLLDALGDNLAKLAVAVGRDAPRVCKQ